MLDMLSYLDSVFSILVATLVILQTVINFLLPPERAEKYNYIGRTLEFLAKTKSGMSLRTDDGSSEHSNKPSNPNSSFN